MDTGYQSNLGQRTRDNTSNRDPEPDQDQQERRPVDSGEADPADWNTRGDQIEPENDELWKPEDLERSHQHLENQYREGQALGDVFRLYKCDFEGLSTGDQRYLRQPIWTDLGRNQEAPEQPQIRIKQEWSYRSDLAASNSVEDHDE